MNMGFVVHADQKGPLVIFDDSKGLIEPRITPLKNNFFCRGALMSYHLACPTEGKFVVESPELCSLFHQLYYSALERLHKIIAIIDLYPRNCALTEGFNLLQVLHKKQWILNDPGISILLQVQLFIAAGIEGPIGNDNQLLMLRCMSVSVDNLLPHSIDLEWQHAMDKWCDHAYAGHQQRIYP